MTTPYQPQPLRRQPEVPPRPPPVLEADAYPASPPPHIIDAELLSAPCYPPPAVIDTGSTIASAYRGLAPAQPWTAESSHPKTPQTGPEPSGFSEQESGQQAPTPRWPPPHPRRLTLTKKQLVNVIAAAASIAVGLAILDSIDPYLPWKRTHPRSEDDAVQEPAWWSGTWVPPLGKTPRLELDDFSFTGHLVLQQGSYFISLPICNAQLDDGVAIFTVTRRVVPVPSYRGPVPLPQYQHYLLKLNSDPDKASLWRLTTPPGLIPGQAMLRPNLTTGKHTYLGTLTRSNPQSAPASP